MFNADGTRDGEPWDATYYLAACSTCDDVILYWEVDDVPQGSFVDLNMVWPDRGVLPDAVPKRVRDIYREAFAIRFRAPNAYAGQIRRALEANADDRNAKPGKL